MVKMKNKQYMFALCMIFVAIMMVVPSVSAETDFERIRALQMEMRHATVTSQHTFLTQTAQGMINYISDIGGDTTELESLKKEYDDLLSELTATDRHIDLNDLLHDKSRPLMKSFREEYRSQFDDNDGKPLLALATLSLIHI